MQHLDEFDLPRKLLVTLFLAVLSCGFGVAHLYLQFTMARASGEERWLPSLRDITLYFHGERSRTRLKHMVTGPMKEYFSADNTPERLSPEEQADLDAVLAWNDRGAPEAEYWNPQKHDEHRQISEILFRRGCLDCHVREAAAAEAKPDSPLDTYPGISRFVRPDTGMDPGRLLMLSHVHLLGMALMFLGVGAALSATRWAAWLRASLICGCFASILLDIGGWWAVKYGGAGYAWTVLAGGLLMGVLFGWSVLATGWDMWRKKSRSA